MINRLIDLTVKVPTHNDMVKSNGNYTVQQYATAFLTGLSQTQKQRFKQMLEKGIESGMSVASSYGIDYKDFITEVKNQLKLNN